jgi:excinuclease ABC subunit A
VVKTADWIIDFGPEGGDGGGEIVGVGTPETIARNTDSWTGQFLKESLERHHARVGAQARKTKARAAAVA